MDRAYCTVPVRRAHNRRWPVPRLSAPSVRMHGRARGMGASATPPRSCCSGFVALQVPFHDNGFLFAVEECRCSPPAPTPPIPILPNSPSDHRQRRLPGASSCAQPWDCKESSARVRTTSPVECRWRRLRRWRMPVRHGGDDHGLQVWCVQQVEVVLESSPGGRPCNFSISAARRRGGGRLPGQSQAIWELTAVSIAQA